jgi:hypothetical protein
LNDPLSMPAGARPAMVEAAEAPRTGGAGDLPS